MKRFILSCILVAISCGVARSQELALSSNLADCLKLATLNLGAEYALARHWSINTTIKYNPFRYASGEQTIQDKERSVSLSGRFWTWHFYSGWWVSAGAKYQEFSHTALQSQLTSEGDRLGVTAGLGYSYMLREHFNLDLGLAFWSGYEYYTTYSCPTCGRMIDRGGRSFFLPSELILALYYIF